MPPVAPNEVFVAVGTILYSNVPLSCVICADADTLELEPPIVIVISLSVVPSLRVNVAVPENS